MMNRVVLVGRLTKDPDLRYTPAGAAVATFTLAVNRPFKNGQGEQEADFIQCVVWRKPAENVANFLKKGSLTGVDGRVQTRNYEGNDGKRVYVTEIVAESVQFLEPKQNAVEGSTPNNNQNEASYSNNNKNGSYRASSSQNSDSFANEGKPIDISDDDLPF
ncbi:TPA: single-stranded DNA-binding protein [Listeria monocytogenes]|uniref:Single-stranded DNA-binding protein n=3 Tax=Listeria TaxID=1637 RepID=A0A3R0H1W6_LISMN|nr:MULTISPECIES: single-stranded DNA-binding protein [Listeria]EAF3065151.1 single-stranded DNA-binding protein [Listeria monocytogenes serotype 1/2a]EKE4577089.1 single-stranded DNA-binding protein [Listeria monocytogenes serotype 1/2b]AGR02062.1 single-stranded DNA-binding protein [Listeria monocytogenes]AQP66259.1 single-stranded DNA-binding protein [Listeria monocytogenes]ARJ79070.1 single-stranded DNA-binding protein [Listeria monocytogenes]